MYHGSENGNSQNYDMYGKRKNDQFYNIGSEYLQHKTMEPPADYVDHKQDTEENMSLDSQGKQKTFVRLCQRFAEKTSMQGIPYINSAKLWYAKACWVVILLGGLGGMTLHLYFLIAQYLDFGVQVSVSLGFSNLDFPAVTICNVNTIKKNQLNKTSQQLQSLVAQTDPAKLPPPSAGGPPGRRKRFVEDFNIDFNNLSQTYDYSKKKGTKEQTYQIKTTFDRLYMEETGKTRYEIGHHLKDMLLQCSFAGYECYFSNFTLIQTKEYGNCFKIQSSDFVTTNPGPENGLSLILYMENEEYLTGINQGFGARVLVHDTDTYPFPAQEGFYVSSSFETHVGLKRVSIIRESAPYGDCQNVESYKLQHGAKYTRTLCQLICYQEEIIAKCNCFDYSTFDVFHTLNTSVTVKPCKSPTEKDCLGKKKADQETTPPACTQCFNPCQENQYVKSLSSRNWPTDEYANVLMQGVCETLPDKCAKIREFNTNNDISGLAKTFVKLVIYFEDLNYEVIQEVPEIEPQQFASDVGGAIGLWIGLSMISIFEVVQLLLECCAFSVYKCRQLPKGKSSNKYKSKPGQADDRINTKLEHFSRPRIANGNIGHYNDWNNRS